MENSTASNNSERDTGHKQRFVVRLAHVQYARGESFSCCMVWLKYILYILMYLEEGTLIDRCMDITWRNTALASC